MEPVFWTNTVWYVLLGVTTVIEIAFTLQQAPDRRAALAFYFTLAGMTLWLETVLLILLGAYAYYPRIITDSVHAYDDILAGNLFSQFSVAASMFMAAVLRLKPRWYIMLALAYGAIEELFLALGIYEQFWYQTCFTVVLLPFAFLVARKMYDRLSEGLKPGYYYTYVFFSLFALTAVTLLWGLKLADVQNGAKNLSHNPDTSNIAVVLASHAVISTGLLVMYFSGMRWRFRVLSAAALEALYYGLYRAGLLVIRDGWFWPVSAAVLLWTYASIALMDRLYGLSGGALMRRRT